MSRRQNLLIILFINSILLLLPKCGCFKREPIFQSSLSTTKLSHLPYTSRLEHASSHRFKSTVLSKGPVVKDYFQIDPSDATDGIKYSQPAVDHYAENPYPVPSNFQNRNLPIATDHLKSPKQTPPSDEFLISTQLYEYNGYGDVSKWKISPKHKTPSQKVRAIRIHDYIDSSGSKLESNGSIQRDKFNATGFSSSTMLLESANGSMALLLPVSSENVLSYENSPSLMDKDDYKYAVPVKKSSDQAIEDASSHSENTKSIYPDSTLSPTVSDVMTLPPIFITSLVNDVVNQSVSLNNSETTNIPSSYDVENISSSSMTFPSDNHDKLSQGTIAGIVIGILVCATILSSAVIYLLYQKYNGKCTNVVEGKFNSDNCGYLDDSLRSSIYLNNHIELPKESSEEMSSLDNDSFLNSLETMTIQNYWADNSKNTKVKYHRAAFGQRSGCLNASSYTEGPLSQESYIV